MAYELRADEKAGKAVRRLVRKQIQNAVRVLTEAGPDKRAEAVHEARKRIKKIRTALRLFRAVLGDEVWRNANRTFRDIGRRLSEVRDAEILVESAGKLADGVGGPLPAGLVEHVRGVLSARRDAAVRRAFEETDEPGHVIVQLAEARDRMAEWPRRHSGWSALRGGLKRIYSDGGDAMETAYADPTFENFHEWRKRVKDLWQTLVLFTPMWPAVLGPASDQVHKLSDKLGDDHDLSVLEQTVSAAPDEFGPADQLAALSGLIEQRRNRLRAEAKPLGRRIYAGSPGGFRHHLHAWWRVWRDLEAERAESEQAEQEQAEQAGPAERAEKRKPAEPVEPAPPARPPTRRTSRAAVDESQR